MKIAFEKQKFGRRWFATPETFPAAMNRGASLPRQLIVRKSVCRRTEWCAPSAQGSVQNFKVAPNQMVRVPGSGPKNPPGETVPVIVPNVLGAVVLPVRHAVPVLPGHPAFGFAKWGVLVNPKASARTSNE